MYRWLHSPQLVIGFFPEWFAAVQPDWPPHTHLVGFPLWDTGRPGAIPEDAETFLAAGPPPIVFTPGSAAATLASATSANRSPPRASSACARCS